MNIPKRIDWIHIEEKDFDSLPEKPAIYLVVVDTINNNYLVIYTGATINIKDRAKQHWLESEQNKELKNLIKNYRSAVSLFYAFDDKELIDKHERFLFERFEPQLKHKTNSVNPIEINVPEHVVKGRLNKKYFA